MRIYAALKKEFKFLAKTYGFKIISKQKHGYGLCDCITWTNSNKNITVLYDEKVEDPISIHIFDSYYVDFPFAFDDVEYKNEFEQRSGTPREKIHRAAEWLNNAIADKRIIV